MNGSEELQKIEFLLAESRAERFRSPERAVYFAELASAAAERLDPAAHPAKALADTRSRVWAELGNAYRLSEELARAESAFDQAVSWFERGSGGADLLGTIVDRFTALLAYRRRFEEALALLDRLVSFHLSRGERDLAGRALIKRGLYTENWGAPEPAIGFTLRGLALLDDGGDPVVRLAGIHNLLWCASTIGRFQLIERLLPKVRPLYGGDRLNLLRLAWVEARVASGLGRTVEGERIYEAARDGFVAAGLIFPASLVSLELSLLWLSAGRNRKVAALAAELAASFRHLKVGREVIVALLLLRRAVEEGHEEEALVSRVRSIAEAIRTLGR